MISHITIILILLAVLPATVLSQCYYPGGDWAADHQPCHPHDFTSFCCPYGYTCFSGSLCVMTDPNQATAQSPLGTSLRGSCTNPAWNQTACGGFCLDDPATNNEGTLVSCGNDRWCCGPDAESGYCNCDTGRATFSASLGTAVTVIGVQGKSYTSTVPARTTFRFTDPESFQSTAVTTTVNTFLTTELVTSGTITELSVSTTVMTTIPPPTDSHTISPTPSETAQSAVNDTSSMFTSSSSASLPSQSSKAGNTIHSTGFKAGVGAGVPLAGLVVIGLLVTWFCSRRRQNRPQRRSSNPLTEDNASDIPESTYHLDPPPLPAVNPYAQGMPNMTNSSIPSYHTVDRTGFAREFPARQ